MINALFRVERALSGAPRRKRERLRKSKSAPMAERLFSWCEAELERVLDDTPAAKCIRYALNQR